MSDENFPSLDQRSPERVREIVKEAVAEFGPKVIQETLMHMGFDVSNPLAIQEQQQYLRRAVAREADPEVQKQRAWLADTVKRCNAFYDNATSIAMKGIGTFVFVILGFGIVAWLKEQLK